MFVQLTFITLLSEKNILGYSLVSFMFIYLYLIFHECHTKKNISRLVAMACSSHCIDDTLYISIFNVVSERLEVSVTGKGSTNIMRKTFSPHATIRGPRWGVGLFTKPMFVIIS